MSWYVGMGHDPEVPAGYQDADIEMAELREAAAEAEAEAEAEEDEDDDSQHDRSDRRGR